MIDVYWDTTQPVPVVRLDYTDPITSWAEYREAIAASNRLILEQAPTPVYMLHNPGGANMPPGSALPHLREAVQTTPDNVAMCYMVISNSLARYITEVTMKILVPSVLYEKYLFVETLNEAYALIQTRETL